MKTKVCEVCGGSFYKKAITSIKSWKKQKYCSQKCSLTKTSIEKSPFQYHFEKGHVPWSKNQKGVCLSPKTKFKKGNKVNLGRVRPKGVESPKWSSVEKECIICHSKYFVQKYRTEKSRFCTHACYHKWHIGRNSPVWTDNFKKRLRDRIMALPEYKKWRKDVFDRDYYYCQECGRNKSGSLEAHHLKSMKELIEQYKITDIDMARSCQELWDLNNGRTLCKSCHRKTNTYGKKLTIYYAR